MQAKTARFDTFEDSQRTVVTFLVKGKNRLKYAIIHRWIFFLSLCLAGSRVWLSPAFQRQENSWPAVSQCWPPISGQEIPANYQNLVKCPPKISIWFCMNYSTSLINLVFDLLRICHHLSYEMWRNLVSKTQELVQVSTQMRATFSMLKYWFG